MGQWQPTEGCQFGETASISGCLGVYQVAIRSDRNAYRNLTTGCINFNAALSNSIYSGVTGTVTPLSRSCVFCIKY